MFSKVNPALFCPMLVKFKDMPAWHFYDDGDLAQATIYW